MLKIQYQKKYGVVIIPEQGFESMIKNFNAKEFEFEEVELMTSNEDNEYNLAINELVNGKAVSYEELLNMRNEKPDLFL
jgi:BRCT domain type II-containing protein